MGRRYPQQNALHPRGGRMLPYVPPHMMGGPPMRNNNGLRRSGGGGGGGGGGHSPPQSLLGGYRPPPTGHFRGRGGSNEQSCFSQYGQCPQHVTTTTATTTTTTETKCTQISKSQQPKQSFLSTVSR